MRAVVLGKAGEPVLADIAEPDGAGETVREEVALRGAFYHAPRHIRAALAFLASGADPFGRLVTHRKAAVVL